MKKKLAFLALIAGLLLCGGQSANAGAVSVTLYGGFVWGGDGSPFSNPVQTFLSPDVNFGDTWFPTGFGPDYGERGFGAVVQGTLIAPATGSYYIGLVSDDGSAFYVNGASTPALNNPNDHGPTGVYDWVTLNAGTNTFRINFYENGYGESTLRLVLLSDQGADQGLTYGSAVPLPAGILLLGPGLVGLAALRRRIGK